MQDNEILISYDGGDAYHNTIEARLFGQSLQGLDRMVSDCLVILTLERLPKRNERAPLLLKAREPEAGSVNVPQLFQEASELLGIGVPVLTTIGPEIVGHYVSAVLDHFKGSDSSVDLAINRMADMHRVALEAMTNVQKEAFEKMDRVDERRHHEQMSMHDLLRLAIMGSGSAAVDYVAPVGKSVNTASFYSGKAPPVLTNKDDADAIRDSQKLDWNPIGSEVLTTDGFKFHTSGLSIENPERDGFLMAEVVDPVFADESNPYTLAAQKRASIEVLARKGYKNGKLSRIQVVEFVREVRGNGA